MLASSSTIVVWSQVHCVFRGLRIQLYRNTRPIITEVAYRKSCRPVSCAGYIAVPRGRTRCTGYSVHYRCTGYSRRMSTNEAHLGASRRE